MLKYSSCRACMLILAFVAGATTISTYAQLPGNSREQQIIERLKLVKDFELDINIYDLGLVRKIEITPNHHVSIEIIFTKLFCPYGKQIVYSIKKEVGKISWAKSCKVKVDIKTRWKRDFLTEEGKRIMKDRFSW